MRSCSGTNMMITTGPVGVACSQAAQLDVVTLHPFLPYFDVRYCLSQVGRIVRHTEGRAHTRPGLDFLQSLTLAATPPQCRLFRVAGMTRWGSLRSETGMSRSKCKDLSPLGGLFLPCATMEGTVCPSSSSGRHDQSYAGTLRAQAYQCTPNAVR